MPSVPVYTSTCRGAQTTYLPARSVHTHPRENIANQGPPKTQRQGYHEHAIITHPSRSLTAPPGLDIAILARRKHNLRIVKEAKRAHDILPMRPGQSHAVLPVKHPLRPVALIPRQEHKFETLLPNPKSAYGFFHLPNQKNLLLSAGADNRTATVRLAHHVRDILAPQHAPQVAPVLRGIAPLGPLIHVIQRKLLVVRKRHDLGPREEPSAVNGRAVVERLQRDVVLVRDARVVHVDQAVRRAAQQKRRLARPERQLRHVVAVHLLVVRAGAGAGPHVPGEDTRRVVPQLGAHGDGLRGRRAGHGQDGRRRGFLSTWSASYPCSLETAVYVPYR